MKYELNVPSGLHEITLGQYQEYIERIEKHQDDLQTIKMIALSVFCRVPMGIVRNIKQTSLDEISDHFMKILNKNPEMNPFAMIGDKEFGFIPKLDDMSAGEYADLERYIGNWNSQHKAMAILYRPITKKRHGKYDIEEYEGSDKYSEVMKHLTLDVVFGSNVFFYTLGNDLLNFIVDYLQKETANMMTSAEGRNSVKDGDGINRSISSLKGILQDLMKLQSNRYINL